MLECKDELQCPFIFCANDTLIKEEFPEPNVNWMGFDNIMTLPNIDQLS